MTPEGYLILASVLVGVAVALGPWCVAPLWDRIAQRQVQDLTPRLRELSLDVTLLPRYLRWWGLAMVGAALVCWLVLGIPIVGVVVVFLIYVAPRLLLSGQIARRRQQLRDQMVGAGVSLANATRAGLSLAQGLEAISKETPEPLAAEFRRLVRDYQRGRPLADTIRDAKTRLNLDGFTLFANAILTCLERGGKVTDALERISRSLQENQRLERKIDADTASGRRVVLLLGIFPVVFLIGFYLMDPESTGLLFSTILGQVVLVAIAALVYFSVRWAGSILAIDI